MMPPATGAYGAGGYVPLSRPGVPFTIPVYIRNASDQPVSGKLRVAVIDDWKIQSPDTVQFSVASHEEALYEFTMTFGPRTYNAHYPVHAYVDFDYRGQKLTAHPILILETKIPDLPRPKLPAEWKPVPVPAGGKLGLWRLPVRRETAQVANTGAEAGQSRREAFEAAQWVTYGALDVKEPREGITMMLGKRAPSNRETVDGVAVEYPLALPAGEAVRLSAGIAGPATFRVEALPFEGGGPPEVLFETAPGRSWEAVNVDLKKYAGTNVLIRLSALRGATPVHWAEPTVIGGDPPPPADRPVALRTLGKAGGCEVRVAGGSSGVLNALVSFDCGSHSLGFHGFRVRAAGDALEDAQSAAELVRSPKNLHPDAIACATASETGPAALTC